MKIQNLCTTVDDVSQTPSKNHSSSVSITIKAFNEERNIGRCIESAIAALSELPNPSEIIVADSVSADRTVEIARRYPVTVVQFQSAAERGCGAGVQLGFQHSCGDFVMLLDGDMEMLPGFLPLALERLANEPKLAGVAGLVQDTTVRNAFDRRRVERGVINRPRNSAPWLSGGGLYRREAILAAGGYAADRNLKAWEEAELGLRLTAAGWSLERLEHPSTLHTGHPLGTGQLLRSLWRSRRLMANGVLIKQAIGNPWMFKALRMLIHPLCVILVWFGAVISVGVSVITQSWQWAAGYMLAVSCLALLLVAYKRSVKQTLLSLSLWHIMAAALLLGLREKVVPPGEPIRSLVLSSPSRD